MSERLNRTVFICTLIEELVKVTNNKEANFKLKKLSESVACTAPEIIPMRLRQLYQILTTYCRDNTTVKVLYHEALFDYFDAIDEETRQNKKK
jgi:hypothetical protein